MQSNAEAAAQPAANSHMNVVFNFQIVDRTDLVLADTPRNLRASLLMPRRSPREIRVCGLFCGNDVEIVHIAACCCGQER